ncbi:unnamed protein product [Effrenium voratum]|uniref:Uncharacterized protein n=1 Tax=Effrenium voratum TaxID=2562239 RepID=A0AA36IX79_9DINO|nr:unnamed protein product [Effrenium voratum]
MSCWVLGLGKPRLLTAKLQLACRALRAQRCAEATCFFGFVARTSKSSQDHCTGVSSRGCQCLSCGKCRWHLSRCEQESSVSSWLSELTCHVRPEAFPSCSCLCLSYEPEQQLSPRAEAKFRQRLALFKRSSFVFYVLLDLSCQFGRDFY